jgi:meso-butanediol dehydrogenase / (S,S)-butanediol dehydrogenase / diacetyl reductase
MSNLQGRVASVTGAGAGLGQAIALEFSRAGASIAVVDIDQGAARENAGLLAAEGAECRTYVADVADREAVGSTWDKVASDLGRLDIVVNNAGVSFVGPHIADTTDEAWHESIDVMQHGVCYGMRAAARHMLHTSVPGWPPGGFDFKSMWLS